ncbi:MAG TPA: hypothetical protein VHC43_02840 [Mycobacteriales bacterium]|nr:hypothetical protein [Mycobacteriales bacterium]
MTTDPATGAPVPAPDPMSALVDIRNQVIRLGQEVAALRAEQPAQNPDAINSVTAELREAVRFLAERLDGVARMVAQRGEELADTRGALGAIDAHVRSQAETIGVLTTGMQALPSYGQQVSAVQESLNGLQQRLGGIEGSLGQRLGGIEQALARPTDAQVSERLSAIEGMLGPLAQRLAQAHNDHAASLQSLHGKLESLAAGTQAALAQPATIDEGALAGLEPKLSALAGEIQSLRSDVAGVVAARESSASAPAGAPVDLAPVTRQLAELSDELQTLRSDVAGVVAARASSDGGSEPVDLSPISEQLSGLSDQLAALAAAPPAGGEASPAPSGDLDAAINALEQRITTHVDDAVFALAQTLLGRAGAVALVDAPAPPQPEPPAPIAAAHHDEGDSRHGDDARADEVDDRYGDDGDDEGAADVAQIDFSRAGLDDDDDAGDDDDADTTSIERPAVDDAEQRAARWVPEPPYGGHPADEGGAPGPAPVSGVEVPFDQEAVWGTPPMPASPDAPATVVPERRRRWFSW